jgi:hypothetical protein
MEISSESFREFRMENETSPAAAERHAALIPSPLSGLALSFSVNRWFAPPANFQCPSGTTLSTAVKVHDTL